MNLYRKFLVGAIGAGLLSATAMAQLAATEVPAAPAAPVLPVQVPPAAPAPTPAAAEPVAAPAPVRRAAASSDSVDSELTCLAKIVVHEAGNQSRDGQLAVAQVVMNRVRSPRFPNTICAVAMQPGQFFNVNRYNPPRDSRWRRALEVARDAREGVSPPVVGNALFFQAAYSRSAFFNSRTRVARLGDHIFYR